MEVFEQRMVDISIGGNRWPHRFLCYIFAPSSSSSSSLCQEKRRPSSRSRYKKHHIYIFLKNKSTYKSVDSSSWQNFDGLTTGNEPRRWWHENLHRINPNDAIFDEKTSKQILNRQWNGTESFGRLPPTHTKQIIRKEKENEEKEEEERNKEVSRPTALKQKQEINK